MPSISRLPDSATRLISSHVVVVTPVSLVKELLENSIDAKAASVEVLVSPDTISRIEIRDDGVGIHPDDYDSLGRRGYTSKLRAIGELGEVAGKTLGFRGEALASVNSLADVTITTKRYTEPVAMTLQLIPDEGGVLTQRSASAPVGTTVKVTKLFGRQPVREQMSLKEAKKNLDKIQELLRSYAMARPQLKLVFKVLQNSTKIWSYSPKPNATVAEAALQVFGVGVTSNCFLKSVQGSNPNGDSDSSITQGFVLEAFLANPEAEHQNVPKRHYLSVDRRPINAGRGIAKKLLNIYIEYLNTYMTKKGVTDSFICLNIYCPSGSYDANIEPSKDSVSFSNENAVLDTFRHLCDEIYKPSEAGDTNRARILNAHRDDGPIIKLQDSHHGSQSQSGSPDHAHKTKQAIPTAMPEVTRYNPIRSVDESATVDESLRDQGSREIQTSIEFTPININDRHHDRHQGSRESPGSHKASMREKEQNSVGYLNPWVIAKMNGLSEPSMPKPDLVLQSPPRSQVRSEPPILRHTMAPPGDLDVPRTQQNVRSAKPPYVQRCTVPGGSYGSPVTRSSDGQPQRGPLTRSYITQGQHHREQPPWTPPSSLERNQCIDVLQAKSDHSPKPDGFKQTQISFDGKRTNRPQVGPRDEDARLRIGFQIPSRNLDVDNDFNLQRAFTTARQNLQYQLSQMKQDQSPRIPQDEGRELHHEEPMCQKQPVCALQGKYEMTDAFKEPQAPIATTLPAGDPRAYLLRRQKSIAAEESGAKPRRLRRVKSCLLPLETIPPEYKTHGLSCDVVLDCQALGVFVRMIRGYDKYISRGALIDGIDISLADGREIEARLQHLLTDQKRGAEDEGNNAITIDLQAALKGKGLAKERQR